MLPWHVLGFTIVVVATTWVARIIAPGVPRLMLFGLVVAGAWVAHSHYYIQSGPFLRDTVLAPILGHRPAAERLAYVLEAKAWQKTELRRELRTVPVFERPGKVLQLAYQGIPRLGDSSQARWLRLIAHLAERGRDNECGPLGRGEVSPEVWFRMLNRLGEEKIREFYDLSLEAVVAGTVPSSSPVSPMADTTAVMLRMTAALYPHEQTRFRNAALSLQVHEDKDACWMVKTLFTGFERLPYSSRVVLLQTFATDASQKVSLTTASLR